MKKILFTLLAGLFITSNAVAVPTPYIVDGAACATYQVTATGYVNSDACRGLYDNTGSGNFNDSESLLNNVLLYGDGSDPTDQVWSSAGAFGYNDWEFLGKDDQPPVNTFFDVTSGDPATWETSSELYGDYVIAIKQAGELGFWFFDDLIGQKDGTILINDIFGDGFTDDGWSHVSIYGRESNPVPEPGIIALLAVGLIGVVAVRRRRNI